MISFSASEMIRDLRSGPATIRSSASSNSDIPIVLRLRRAARIAPSLTRFARSAPENPGDWRERSSIETFLSSGLPLMWTRRIAARPFMFGRARMTRGAKRPGGGDGGAVGGGDDDDVRVRVEAVHLDEDLVEGLLPLVVAAAEAGAALAADRVDLVHEDDARAVALRLVEQVADAAGAD